MPSMNDEQPGGWRPQPGQAKPTEPEHVPFTINGRDADAPPPIRVRADTPATMTYEACQVAAAAQRALNAEAYADFDNGHGTLTEKGLHDKKASIRNSPAANVIDMGEQAILQRQAEAQARYDTLIGARAEGDAAQEIRNQRLLDQTRRKIEAAKSTGERVAIAARELEHADNRAQRGLLADEYAALFAGTDTGWVEATMVRVDPELATAAREKQLAAQSAAIGNYMVGAVRKGFVSGNPPTQLGTLAGAVHKYDPDNPANYGG
jgi:hypothetical protein